MKVKLLKALNLKGFLVTDGKNPINLFNTANGNSRFIIIMINILFLGMISSNINIPTN